MENMLADLDQAGSLAHKPSAFSHAADVFLNRARIYSEKHTKTMD